MHERKRKLRRTKSLLGQAQQHDRILAAGEEKHGVRAFAGDLAQDEYSLGLEPVEVAARRQRAAIRARFFEHRAHASLSAVERISRPSGATCSPHSRASLIDRKSTRLNSSHRCISYAVFCLKK